MKEGIGDEELRPNYPDRTSDLAQNMEVKFTVATVVKIPATNASTEIALFDRSIQLSKRQMSNAGLEMANERWKERRVVPEVML